MEDTRFDRFTRGLGTRRTTLGALLGAVAGLIGLSTDDEADAKKRKHKRKRGGNQADAATKQNTQVHAAKKKKRKKKKPIPPTSPPPNTPPPTDGGKSCAAGTIVCGETCVNPQTDALNCGGCGGRCGNGVACVGGRCVSSCPSSQIRCGDLCVDPTSNEDHCGGCLQACSGDLTCLNSTCGCAGAGLSACGNTCVDLQEDDDNCGRCGVTCNGNQICTGGQCVSTPCGPNELDCGNGVCAGGANPCCSYFDCGGGNGDLTCDTTSHQCVCDRPDEGICKRFPNGAGLCDRCCGSGSRICIDDTVCVDASFDPQIRFCDCPAGKRRCAGSQNAHKCQEGIGAQDNRRCGIGCEDCTRTNPSGYCCNGFCLSPCEPNTRCDPQVCSNCQFCPSGTNCCRVGATALFGCAVVDEFGRCPGPPA